MLTSALLEYSTRLAIQLFFIRFIKINGVLIIEGVITCTLPVKNTRLIEPHPPDGKIE